MSNKPESDTPRTDSIKSMMRSWTQWAHVLEDSAVIESKIEQLERDLNAANANAQSWKNQYTEMSIEQATLQTALIAANAKLERYREELEKGNEELKTMCRRGTVKDPGVLAVTMDFDKALKDK